MGDRMGSSPIDRTNKKDDSTIVFFHFLPKMMRRCRSVCAHVRCARATQMQALDCPSLAVDRTKKILTLSRVSIFFTRETGLERDVKKTAQCAVFSPRRVNRVSGAKKGVQNVRKDCGASPIDRTNRKDDNVIVFFSFSAKMMRRCRSVGAHVRFARATQMQAHNIGDPAGY